MYLHTYIHTYIGRSYPSTASNRINSNQIKLNAAMSSMSSPPWLLGGILFDVFSCILKKQCACCIHVHKTVTASVCESRMCLAYFLACPHSPSPSHFHFFLPCTSHPLHPSLPLSHLYLNAWCFTYRPQNARTSGCQWEKCLLINLS